MQTKNKGPAVVLTNARPKPKSSCASGRSLPQASPFAQSPFPEFPAENAPPVNVTGLLLRLARARAAHLSRRRQPIPAALALQIRQLEFELDAERRFGDRWQRRAA